MAKADDAFDHTPIVQLPTAGCMSATRGKLALTDVYCDCPMVGSVVALGELTSSQLCPYVSVSDMVAELTLASVTAYVK